MKSKLSTNLKIGVPLIIFSLISIVSIYSSRTLLSESYNNLYIKQILWYILGLVCLIIVSKTKNNFLIDYSYIFYIIGVVSLIAVLFFGILANGARCWFTVPGIGSVQPSEFMKIFLILTLAKILNDEMSHYQKTLKSELMIITKCFIITLIPSILTFLEPDTGIVLIYFFITLVMLFVFGIRYRWFISLFSIVGILAGGFLYLFFIKQNVFINIFGTNFFYRMDRLLDWSNGSGMQLTNAMAATGSAFIKGYGINNTPIYFPEPQTDFIFSVFSSNFGFIGSAFLIALIIYFDMQIIKVGINSDSKNKYVIAGIISMLIFQQVQNISMNIGLLPITGITLPFISYGGSSLISYMFIMGIVFNVVNNTKKE